MLGLLDGFDPWHIASYAAAWFGLFALAVALAVGGRRSARRHSLPLDAPADLDAYELAVLAGGAERLRDAGLAALVERGQLPARTPQAAPYREPPAPPSRPARLPLAVGLQASSPTHVIEASRPAAGPHPVEAALLEAAGACGPGWAASATGAALRLAEGYRAELARQDLLARPGGKAAVTAAMACGALLVVWSILGLVAGSLTQRPGPDGVERPAGMLVACALGVVAAFYLWAAVGLPPGPNRRGDRVLDEAREGCRDLAPPWRPQRPPSPAEMALSVALFGLEGWAVPLAWLHGELYPPSQPSSPV